ncbi:MAG: hypothetical protein ACYCW6_06865 [Candidatus Xenobia bacterium]
MKKVASGLLALVLLCGLAGPVRADDDQTKVEPLPNVDLSLEFSPVSISGDLNTTASFNTLIAQGEMDINHLAYAGVRVQWNDNSNNSTGTFLNVPTSNFGYSDFEIYGRIPFNIMSQGNNPPEQRDPSGPYLLVGWKETQLTGSQPLAVGNGFVGSNNSTFINGNGFGGGVGYQNSWTDKWGFNALFAYYPHQTLSYALNTPGTSQYYNDFVYRLGIRTQVHEGFGLELGYNGESQQFQNASINYSGISFGADLRF